MTLDALAAFVFTIIVIAAIYSIQYSRTANIEVNTFRDLHYVCEDTLDVLNKKGILDEISTYWAENSTPGSEEMLNATDLTREYLEKILPEGVGYKLIIDNDEIVNSSWNPNRTRESNAFVKTNAERLLVGYATGLPTRGLVARASLSNINGKITSAYAYFGGFVGQGNISRELELPNGSNILSAYIELNVGNDFDLFINGNLCNSFSVSASNMSANVKENISSCINLIDRRGKDNPNIFQIEFTQGGIESHYIGGGYIEITYNTTIMDTSPETGVMRFYFPEIHGLINYYSSFYVPGFVNEMTINISFINNFTTFFTIGDKLIFNVNGSTNKQTIINTSAQLLGLLGASAVSEKTVPIRLGTSGISYNVTSTRGNADVVLITDLSGSMRWRIGYNDSTNGVIRDCDDPDLYDNDTRRISLAKCLDKDFVDIILNTSGNRVGLVGFTSSANNWIHSISDDRNSLINEIDSYPDSPTGGTCVCCAINRAINLLSQGYTVIEQGSSNWRYEIRTGCGNSCNPTTASGGCDISNWETPDFDDSSWSTMTLPIYRWWHTNRVYYFRKHFTMSSSVGGNGTLYIRNRRGVECYLNGNLIGVDTSCSWGTYWDNTWNVPSNYFNSAGQDNVLACRVRCGSGWSRRGIEFDAELTIPSDNDKYIIVMTDGITGYHCGRCTYNPECDCSGTCSSTTGGHDCNGKPSDCTGGQCDYAINDAICSSKRAHQELNATVYSIGFGPISQGCPNANRTLWGIANCGNGTAYGSQNASELAEIYTGIASIIVNASYDSQTLTLIGGTMENVTNATLYGYPESYIEFIYNPLNVTAYGSISITKKSERFNNPTNCTGYVPIPDGVNITDMKITSYSSDYWTDFLSINNSKGYLEVYKLWCQYPGVNYTALGDPFIVNILDPEVNVKAGEFNNITVETGKSPSERTNCSADDRAIYTLRVASQIGYGNIFAKSEGCVWNIEFSDGTFTNDVRIPTSYPGSDTCNYTNASIVYDTEDAMDDAVFRLFQSLDEDDDGRLDIKFNPEMVEFKTSTIGGVRSLWGPVVLKLIVWR